MKTITFEETEWKLVPIVPTSGDAYSMVMAGAIALEIQDYLLAVRSNTSRALAVYDAMLAAAPVCACVAAKPVAWLVSHADEPDCVTAWMHPFDCLPVKSKWKNIPLYTAPACEGDEAPTESPWIPVIGDGPDLDGMTKIEVKERSGHVFNADYLKIFDFRQYSKQSDIVAYRVVCAVRALEQGE